VKGKSVLSGDLKSIKKDYRKKNIRVQGDFDCDAVLKIPGVVSLEKETNYSLIKIENETVTQSVFEIIKNGNNITEFRVEDPTLNEIFLSKVGESYEG